MQETQRLSQIQGHQQRQLGQQETIIRSLKQELTKARDKIEQLTKPKRYAAPNTPTASVRTDNNGILIHQPVYPCLLLIGPQTVLGRYPSAGRAGAAVRGARGPDAHDHYGEYEAEGAGQHAKTAAPRRGGAARCVDIRLFCGHPPHYGCPLWRLVAALTSMCVYGVSLWLPEEYITRVSELEIRCSEQGAQPQPPSSGPSDRQRAPRHRGSASGADSKGRPPSAPQSQQTAQLQQRVNTLQKENAALRATFQKSLQAREEEVNQLREALSQKDTALQEALAGMRSRLQHPGGDSITPRQMAGGAEVQKLRQQVARLQQDNELLHRELDSLCEEDS